MGFFSKKLTSGQEKELAEFSKTLASIQHEYDAATRALVTNTEDLYGICRLALQENRDLSAKEYLTEFAGDYRHPRWSVSVSANEKPLEPIDTASLIGVAGDAIQKYNEDMTRLQGQISSIQIASWYPKKYKKAYDSWALQLKGTLQSLGKAIRGLKQPEPLKHDPEHSNDKLNLFVAGLNDIAMFRHMLGTILPTDL